MLRILTPLLILSFLLFWLAPSIVTAEQPLVSPRLPTQAAGEVKATRVVPVGMVEVPAGEFTMGMKDPIMGRLVSRSGNSSAHKVYLDAYAIGQTEVSTAEYRACVDAAHCSAPGMSYGWCNPKHEKYNSWSRTDREEQPINCVDWEQAQTYCHWRGQRLPTEAEWEKAARGTDARKYPWGEEYPDCSRAVIKQDQKTTGCGEDRIWPVGSKPKGASPYGALDMAGNVWEWTADWYGPYTSAPLPNPQGPSTGKYRVKRGGSFTYFGNQQKSAKRSLEDPSMQVMDLGFRCAQSL